jgi:hypothetical protein
MVVLRWNQGQDEIAGEFSVIMQPFCQVKYISAEESISCRFIRSVQYGWITVRELFLAIFVFRDAQKPFL